jgi:hypothetical protein
MLSVVTVRTLDFTGELAWGVLRGSSGIAQQQQQQQQQQKPAEANVAD